MTTRSLLVFGLLMTLCASASAATVNHSRTDYQLTAGHSQGVASGFTVPTTLRFGRDWSGYSMYAYDPDCHDFSFRHPDYPRMPSCG
jgi:hypothetical protein